MSYGTKVFTRLAPIGFMALGMAACASDTSPGTQLVIERSTSYDAEIVRYTRLQQEDPRDLQALIRLSRSLRHAGRGDDAVNVLVHAESSFGSNADYLAELGKAYLVAGELSAARVVLTSAVQQDGNNWQALAALGVINTLEHRHTQARYAYNRALNVCPNSAAILNNLALSESYSGDVTRSMNLLTRALQVQPMSLRIHQNMLTLGTLESRCVTCSREEYARLARAIYPPDWISTANDISCDDKAVSAYMITAELDRDDFIDNKVVSADMIVAELDRNDFIDMRVLFAFDSTELTPEANEALDELGTAMKSDTLINYRFSLEGHTDAVGTDAYNLDLSNQRAASVKKYLLETHGIDTNRLESIGFGESQLAEPSDPMSGINRRVRVVKIERIRELPVAGL